MSDPAPKPSVLGTAILAALITLWAVLIVLVDDAVNATIDHYEPNSSSARMKHLWESVGAVFGAIFVIVAVHYTAPFCKKHPLSVSGQPDFVAAYSELHSAKNVGPGEQNGTKIRLPGPRSQ